MCEVIGEAVSVMVSVDKAIDVVCEKLSPKHREAVEAFVSVLWHLPAGYRKSFPHGYLPLY